MDSQYSSSVRPPETPYSAILAGQHTRSSRQLVPEAPVIQRRRGRELSRLSAIAGCMFFLSCASWGDGG